MAKKVTINQCSKLESLLVITLVSLTVLSFAALLYSWSTSGDGTIDNTAIKQSN